jgi:ABC-type polysaccharide/polyol phosphate transport system ATPase subunit
VSEPAYAIEARGIGKRYRIGSGGRGATIRDRVGSRLGGRDREPPPDETTVWALRDVSFKVPPGKVLGVVGRNGSGKTTLMRILSRVTAPTEGSAIVRGRVGALFQVGTGFHPELTGRENIALSGTILGMTDEETRAAFDEIVDFAEVGDFLDTPVKHYSSGMYMRLAFSVSAHLQAEILLIDEALAVGDLGFREKSSEHIRSMVRSGRTVVLVTHSLSTIKEMCDQAIVLDGGKLLFDGGTREAIDFYRDLSERVGSGIGSVTTQTAAA